MTSSELIYYSNSSITGIHLPTLGAQLLKDDDNLHPDAHHASFAINYDRLGEFG